MESPAKRFRSVRASSRFATPTPISRRTRATRIESSCRPPRRAWSSRSTKRRSSIRTSSIDVLVAKLKALLDQRATGKGSRGVSGSLREMGLAELVQVLTQGRKSGNLKIRSGNDVGEIHFAEGDVVNALWGKVRGEEAF